MKVALTGGGTGGHVTPLLAVAEELMKHEARSTKHEDGGCDSSAPAHRLTGSPTLLFLGEPGGPLSRISDLPGDFAEVPAGKLRRYVDLENLLDLGRTIQGFFVARRVLRDFRPDVVFSKGGFAAVPVCLAAASLRIPVVIHESDATPGLATRITARVASRICVGFAEAGKSFPAEKVRVTGLPVRTGTRHEARGTKHHNTETSSHDHTPADVFITGGSLGARDMNRFLWRIIPRLLALEHTVLHQVGAPSLGEAEIFAAGLPAELRARYRFAAGLEPAEMARNFRTAQVIVSRAGATTLAEIALAMRERGRDGQSVIGHQADTAQGSLPMADGRSLARGAGIVLFPLPLSKSRGDQLENAKIWAKHCAAEVWSEETSEAEAAFRTIEGLLRDVRNRAPHTENAAKLAVPDASARVAEVIREVARAD